jgi:hypothetical protein
MEPTDRPGGGLLPRSHMQHPFIEDPVAKEDPSVCQGQGLVPGPAGSILSKAHCAKALLESLP